MLSGSKQTNLAHFADDSSFLISKEFKCTESNHSLFVNETTRLIVSIYVDNIQIYGPKGYHQSDDYGLHDITQGIPHHGTTCFHPRGSVSWNDGTHD